MQPKRDPSDRRFWPVRLGGTSGFGMQRYGKPSPYRYGALSDRGSLSDNPNRLRVTARTAADDVKALDAEALRARARLVSDQLLEEIGKRASSMDTDELSGALNAAGKLTGVQVTTQNVTGSVAHLHLDALRQLSAERRLSNSSDASATASAKLIANVSDGNELDAVSEDSASLGQESDGPEGAE